MPGTPNKTDLNIMLFFIKHEDKFKHITSPDEITDNTEPNSILTYLNVENNRKAGETGTEPKWEVPLANPNKQTLEMIKEILQERNRLSIIKKQVDELYKASLNISDEDKEKGIITIQTFLGNKFTFDSQDSVAIAIAKKYYTEPAPFNAFMTDLVSKMENIYPPALEGLLPKTNVSGVKFDSTNSPTIISKENFSEKQ